MSKNARPTVGSCIMLRKNLVRRRVPVAARDSGHITGNATEDPFMGSGTTMAAAALLERVGYGCEISAAYCDVILRRITNLTGATATLAETGETFAAVADSRGVSVDQASNPKQQDSRAIKHRGPNPFYGGKKAS